MLFCEEWDAYLHAECVSAFLQTPDGQVVLKHRHDIVIVFGVRRFGVVEEGPHLCNTCGHNTRTTSTTSGNIDWTKSWVGNTYTCVGCKLEEGACTCDPKDVVGYSPEEYQAAMKDADADGNVEPEVTREFDISALMDRGYTHSEAQAEVDGEEDTDITCLACQAQHKRGECGFGGH
jgi:hypothetical protein